MAEVVWPKRVLVQIAEIVAYIRESDPVAAESVGRRLFAVGEGLAAFPHRGRPTADGERDMTTVWPYVLRYRVTGEVVTVVRVRHGRRRPLR